MACGCVERPNFIAKCLNVLLSMTEMVWFNRVGSLSYDFKPKSFTDLVDRLSKFGKHRRMAASTVSMPIPDSVRFSRDVKDSKGFGNGCLTNTSTCKVVTGHLYLCTFRFRKVCHEELHGWVHMQGLIRSSSLSSELFHREI